MRTGALTGNFILFFSGALLAFQIQPLLYKSRILQTGDQVVETWLDAVYEPSALLVYVVSVASAVGWYWLGSRSRALASKEFGRHRVFWGAIGFAPVLSIIATLVFINTDENAAAQVSLTGLLVLDALVLFWLPTATSSPDAVKYAPFGAFFLRGFLGLN